jgi:hypothetical protein
MTGRLRHVKVGGHVAAAYGKRHKRKLSRRVGLARVTFLGPMLVRLRHRELEAAKLGNHMGLIIGL